MDVTGEAGPISPRKSAATIYDIARHLGLSASTVSRGLNKPGRMKPETEKRIRDAAAELGYRLNPLARALPTGRTGTFALILSDITNPVYFDLLRGAEHVTAKAGNTLILADAQESAEVELATANRLMPSVDGFVLVASRLSDEQILALVTEKPVVLVNREVPGVASVVPDVGPGIAAALNHLVAGGHRSIAYLSGPAASWMSHTRWECVIEEAPARGFSIVEIGPGRPTVDGGRESLKRVLASGVTAVLTYNDLMGIGLLKACLASGIAVPEQLSIIGFDDIFGSDLTTPTLTTIRSPLRAAGEVAVARLLGLDQGGAESSGLRTQFVHRASSARTRT